MIDKSIFINATVFTGNIIVVSDGKLFTCRYAASDFLNKGIQNIINKDLNNLKDQINPIEAIRGSKVLVYTNLPVEPRIYI